jgi:hypothetical protein
MHEIGYKHDVRIVCCGNLQDTNASDLKLATQPSRGRRHEPRVLSFDYDLVVRDEFDALAKEARGTERQAPQSQIGFSGPRRSADQRRALANGDRCCVQALNLARQARSPRLPQAAGEP